MVKYYLEWGVKMNRMYVCIDLKSFYASVECVIRNLNPLTTNLVVADKNRTEKTICLAVSPSLKEYGLSGRSRLYEVIQKVNYANNVRKKNIHHKRFTGKSFISTDLEKNPYLELDYIVAPPQMLLYMKYSTNIYNIYLKYISSKDILVYSIDEVFCDVTDYLSMYNLTAEELTRKIIDDVYKTTGITATAGIGTNMYLAKIAMDITAKHMKPNENGVRIAYLDEKLYKKTLWNHTPLTDFWRVGKGIAKKLNDNNIFTQGDIARLSIENEDKLFKLFGVNAEFLIDHAWGYEPCLISDAKNYKPSSNSLTSGQVLHTPYKKDKARIVLREMIESLVLDIIDKSLVTDQFTMVIGYDIENLIDDNINEEYDGEVMKDFYGRRVPKHTRVTINLNHKTSSLSIITNEIIKKYDELVNPILLIRRINISANNLIYKNDIHKNKNIKQIDLFSNDINEDIDNIKKEEKNEEKIAKAMLDIKKKYGKNSILKAYNYQEGATARDRNRQIGGHQG